MDVKGPDQPTPPINPDATPNPSAYDTPTVGPTRNSGDATRPNLLARGLGGRIGDAIASKLSRQPSAPEAQPATGPITDSPYAVSPSPMPPAEITSHLPAQEPIPVESNPSIDADYPGTAYPARPNPTPEAPKTKADEIIATWREVAEATKPNLAPFAQPTQTPEPTPSTTPVPAPTETPMPTVSPEPTPSPSPSPVETPVPFPTETPAPTPSISPLTTETPSPSPVETPVPAPTEIPSPEVKTSENPAEDWLIYGEPVKISADSMPTAEDIARVESLLTDADRREPHTVLSAYNKDGRRFTAVGFTGPDGKKFAMLLNLGR